MIYLRILAAVFLIIAVFAIAADVTRSTQAQALVFTPLYTHWERLSPTSLKNLESFVSRSASPLVWSLGIRRVLAVPAAVVFLAIGGVLGYFGRQRRRVNIYSN
jgi:hypothetical protein